MYTSLLPLALAAIPAVFGHPAPLNWYQAEDSPVAALFTKRATSPDDPNFANNYPPGWQTPPTNTLPKAWTDRLAAVQVPDIQPSQPNNGYPTYAGGEKPNDDHICSFTYECSTADDLVKPPDGILALSFDDGPTGSSQDLYEFLAQHQLSDKATHFMIGGSILGSPKVMQAAATAGGHIAVHTWSHPYMTTLTNEQVLGELGWTMQIIADLNGGRIPKYWRPPFGDVDNRVRAIAKDVFGMETVPWDKDSGDWAISTGTYTKDGVDSQMSEWLSGPKSPGLNILEHELNSNTTGVFFDSYPKMVSNGWNISNVADAWGMPWYQNSANSNVDAVSSMAVGSGPMTYSGSLSSRSESMTSSDSSSQSVSESQSMSQPQSAAASPTTTASAGSSNASSGSKAASVTPSGAAGVAAQPGMLLAFVGVIAAAFL